MDRDKEAISCEIVELGAVSAETKGTVGIKADDMSALRDVVDAGLSDD